TLVWIAPGAMFERFHGLLLVQFPCVLGAGESSSGRNFGSCGINVPDLLNSEEMAASHMAGSGEIGRGVRRSHEKSNQSGGDVVEVGHIWAESQTIPAAVPVCLPPHPQNVHA